MLVVPLPAKMLLPAAPVIIISDPALFLSFAVASRSFVGTSGITRSLSGLTPDASQARIPAIPVPSNFSSICHNAFGNLSEYICCEDVFLKNHVVSCSCMCSSSHLLELPNSQTCRGRLNAHLHPSLKLRLFYMRRPEAFLKPPNGSLCCIYHTQTNTNCATQGYYQSSFA